MMLKERSNSKIHFSPFCLDLASERLLNGTEHIELCPKAFSVLRLLAERAGTLVTKQDLLQELWPDVHVGDDVLKVAVAVIRKALADSSRAPRFIETAHRKGYRFIADTKTVAADHPEVHSVAALPIPTTHYARSGDVNIAFQVLGEGPLDLVFVMGWVSHLEYFWTEQSFARFLRRMSSFCRLILLDKRGTGLSDRVPLNSLPTLEQRMTTYAVMDTVGSKRAAICGVSEGGAMSALFAATYPERTTALVMIGTYAKRIRDASYPWGHTEAERDEFLEEIREHWGGPVGLQQRAPSKTTDLRFKDWWSAYLRTSASPAAAVALTRMNSAADIRNILPAIRVPTLVIHRTGDQCLSVEEGRYLASRVPGARFVELPGVDHLPFVGDQDAILNELEDFLTGTRHRPATEPVLATVLSASYFCTGVSGQTRRLQRLQDHIQRELEWARGRDCRAGACTVLAHFEGPARAVRCASAIVYHASRLGIQMVAGIHIGECDISQNGIGGSAVITARRIEQHARPGEVLVSGTVRDLVAGSGIRFHVSGAPLLGDSHEPMPLLSVEMEGTFFSAAGLNCVSNTTAA